MARPVSWLKRLPEIRRSVEGSARSHWDRSALEQLFQIQTRTANDLMKILPRVAAPGRAFMVDRNTLVKFLDACQEADAGEEMARRRKAPEKISRRKPRTLVLKDLVTDGRLIALPANITLERGRLEVTFRTVVELCESLAMVAGSIRNDEDAFVEMYEVQHGPTEAQLKAEHDKKEVQKLFAHLREMEEKVAAVA